jgi:hypothetical protein
MHGVITLSLEYTPYGKRKKKNFNNNYKYIVFKGIHAVRIDFFYIKSCQYSMFYTNRS